MEALASAASIIAVVQISGKILTLCHGYISSVRDAKADIEWLMCEVNILKELFESVRTAENSIPVDLLNKTIEELEGLQSQLEPKKRHRWKERLGVQALKWPFKTTEVAGTIGRLERHKTAIANFLLLGLR